jgi:hypothetical protein
MNNFSYEKCEEREIVLRQGQEESQKHKYVSEKHTWDQCTVMGLMGLSDSLSHLHYPSKAPFNTHI